MRYSNPTFTDDFVLVDLTENAKKSRRCGARKERDTKIDRAALKIMEDPSAGSRKPYERGLDFVEAGARSASLGRLKKEREKQAQRSSDTNDKKGRQIGQHGGGNPSDTRKGVAKSFSDYGAGA
ncbi:hypothetical protein KM043_007407 [Ampulex compressa]|nr:hypothetical protein KM043_007407 [Ampulex compressa]